MRPQLGETCSRKNRQSYIQRCYQLTGYRRSSRRLLDLIFQIPFEFRLYDKRVLIWSHYKQTWVTHIHHGRKERGFGVKFDSILCCMISGKILNFSGCHFPQLPGLLFNSSFSFCVTSELSVCPSSVSTSMALVLQIAFFFPPIPYFTFSVLPFLPLTPDSTHTHVYIFERNLILVGGSSWDNLYVMKSIAFIFQKFQHLLVVSRNIIMIYVWKSPRKLNHLYCKYSKKWMKKLKKGKEDRQYLITLGTVTDTHLCENSWNTEWFESHLQMLDEIDMLFLSVSIDDWHRSWR